MRAVTLCLLALVALAVAGPFPGIPKHRVDEAMQIVISDKNVQIEEEVVMEPSDDFAGEEPTNAKKVAAPANCEAALDLIKEAEGFRACTYVDTTGHKTICYGFNLENPDARARVEAVGGNWDSVYNHGGCMTQSQCGTLLSQDVNSAASSAASIFGNQCFCIQSVVTDITYNLGAAGMRTFNTFISLIKAHNWGSAASDLRGTLWCRQVGNRCTRDSGIIANGCG